MSYLCLAESLLSTTLVTGNKSKCEITCVDTDSPERTGWKGEEERVSLVLVCGTSDGCVHSSWARIREWPKWACSGSLLHTNKYISYF